MEKMKESRYDLTFEIANKYDSGKKSLKENYEAKCEFFKEL